MRIEYEGTKLLQIITLNKFRPIEFVYLDPEEFEEMQAEAEHAGALDKRDTRWFTVKDLEIVFYLEHS